MTTSINSYYSSDEDVAWGPLTVREIKRDLTRTNSSNLKKKRRQTVADFSYSTTQENRMEKPIDSTVSTCLDYQTANESLYLEEQNDRRKSNNSVDIICLSSDEDDGDLEKVHIKTEELTGNSRVFDDSLHSSGGSGSHKNIIDLDSSEDPTFETNDDKTGYLTVEDYSPENCVISSHQQGVPYNQIGSLEVSSDSNKLNISKVHERDIAEASPSECLKSHKQSDHILTDSLLSESFDSGSNGSENNVHIEEDYEESSFNDTLDDMDFFLGGGNSLGQDEFKVPELPAKVPLKSPFVDKNLGKTANKFKDIVSPVRLYIKNSPVPVLKKNHKPLMVHTLSQKLLNSSKENIMPIKKHKNLLDTLPEIIYKPSENVLENFESHIIVPMNIKKLLKEGRVIKHEKRKPVNFDVSEVSIEEKLDRGDLSYILSDVKNMSLHVNKQHYNK